MRSLRLGALSVEFASRSGASVPGIGRPALRVEVLVLLTRETGDRIVQTMTVGDGGPGVRNTGNDVAIVNSRRLGAGGGGGFRLARRVCAWRECAGGISNVA